MNSREQLRDDITYQEYIRLQQLRARDKYLQNLRDIVFEEAAEILVTDECDFERGIEEAMTMCEFRTGVRDYLDAFDIEVRDPNGSERQSPEPHDI